MSRGAVGVLGIAVALLLGAWTMSNRPFTGPDEASHYLRALTIAHGQLVGPRVRTRNTNPNPLQAAWVAQDNRGLFVPARLSPPLYPCLNGAPDSGGCVEASYTGDYLPLAYLLPAVGMSGARRAEGAQWGARAGAAVECLLLLLVAVAFAGSSGGWGLLGWLLALTPMTLFVASVVNPNGLEIASGLAFATGLLRLAGAPDRFPRWGWAGLAISGATMILAWQLGIVFVVLQAAVIAPLLSHDRARGLVAARRRALLVLGGVLALASVLFIVYGESAGLFHAIVHFRPVLALLRGGLEQLGPTAHQAVGVFGALTVSLPELIYLGWWVLLIGLYLTALAVGTRREQVALALAAAVAIGFPVLIYAWVFRNTGYGLQGRYVIPSLIPVPLLAGHVVAGHVRQHTGGPALRLWRLALVVVAGLQLGSWWTNARASAGTARRAWFLSGANWSPPLGWYPWAAAATAGAVLLVTLAVVARPRASP